MYTPGVISAKINELDSYQCNRCKFLPYLIKKQTKVGVQTTPSLITFYVHGAILQQQQLSSGSSCAERVLRGRVRRDDVDSPLSNSLMSEPDTSAR